MPLPSHPAARARRCWLARLSSVALIGLLLTAGQALDSSTATAETTSPSTVAAAPPSSGSAAAKAPTTTRATFGIGPLTLGKAGTRPYFSYQMGVGGSLADHVEVFNYGKTPLTLSVFAADLTNSSDGSLAVGLQNEATNDAGSWVRLAARVQIVTLPAQNKNGPGKAVLPLTIAVPRDAVPGDHGAAIVATLSTIGKNPKGENVKLDQRIATRVYVRVAGPLHPRLAVENVKVAYHGDVNPVGSGSATVTYTVHNTGNVRLAASQLVKVSGLLGMKAKDVSPPNLALLFPKASETVTVEVTGVRPTIWQQAHIMVTPRLFADQAPMPVPIAKVDKSFNAVPWTLIGIVALVILLTAVWLLLRHRRQRPLPPGSGRHGRRPGPTGPRGPITPIPSRADIETPYEETHR
jgi:hypothetical protein